MLADTHTHTPTWFVISSRKRARKLTEDGAEEKREEVKNMRNSRVKKSVHKREKCGKVISDRMCDRMVYLYGIMPG